MNNCLSHNRIKSKMATSIQTERTIQTDTALHPAIENEISMSRMKANCI